MGIFALTGKNVYSDFGKIRKWKFNKLHPIQLQTKPCVIEKIHRVFRQKNKIVILTFIYI